MLFHWLGNINSRYLNGSVVGEFKIVCHFFVQRFKMPKELPIAQYSRNTEVQTSCYFHLFHRQKPI